jgi:serine/threonine protein kinase
MSLKDINNVFAQACFGLSYAHNERVVHRDIKPSNIMLLKDLRFDTEGGVKIVDFGLAKIATENEDVQSLTRTGEVMGSPIYMSPEQCSGGKIDYRSDIYSLGCVLFEALTGTPPFIGESALRTMMLHQSEKAPTLKEASLGKDFPSGLERIVAKMLAKSPSDRYRDLGVVAHELAHACTGSDRVLEPKTPTADKDAHKISLTWPRLLLMIAVSNLFFCSATFLVVHWLRQKGEQIVVQKQQPLGTPPPAIDPYQAMVSVPELPDDIASKKQKGSTVSPCGGTNYLEDNPQRWNPDARVSIPHYHDRASDRQMAIGAVVAESAE